jgi:hypothetical protein
MGLDLALLIGVLAGLQLLTARAGRPWRNRRPFGCLRAAACGLAVVSMGAYLASDPARPPDPFGTGACEVESVMLLDAQPAVTYRLDPPFRVVRGGGVVVNWPDAGATGALIRVDLVVDGEQVTLCTLQGE